MKPHDWKIETVDGGPAGDADFWICHECGAQGGPDMWFDFNARTPDGKRMIMSHERKPTPSTFVYSGGSGKHVDVSDDCDEAKAQISTYRKKHPHEAR